MKQGTTWQTAGIRTILSGALALTLALQGTAVALADEVVLDLDQSEDIVLVDEEIEEAPEEGAPEEQIADEEEIVVEEATPEEETVSEEAANDELSAQSGASNTVRYYAQTIGLNRSVIGTFDYNSDGNFEDYYYKFKTSGRRATYRVTLDSLDGRQEFCEVTDEYNHLCGWSNYSQVWTTTRGCVYKSDCDYNAWFYIRVHHLEARRYDKYRITVEELPDATSFSVSNIAGAYAYTGNQICPNPVVRFGNTTLRRNVDYTVSYGYNEDLGTGTVTINGTGKYSGSVTKNFQIVESVNPMTAGRRKATVKVRRSKIRKTWSGLELSSNNIRVSRAKGDVRYTNVSKQRKARKFTVDYYSGKVTIPRNTKKGTYKMRIKVTDGGKYGFKSKTKYVSYTIRVI